MPFSCASVNLFLVLLLNLVRSRLCLDYDDSDISRFAMQLVDRSSNGQNFSYVNMFVPHSADFTGMVSDPRILHHYESLIRQNNFTKILEVGPGYYPFSSATHVVDHQLEKWTINGIIAWNLDMDVDRIPVEDNYFDFVYCRHVLEDLNNPQHAYNELKRVSKNGYIETPSPLIESLLLEVYAPFSLRGYHHHRWFIWTDSGSNAMWGLPKYGLIDIIGPNSVFMNSLIEMDAIAIATDDPSRTWNNHYEWWTSESIIGNNSDNGKVRKQKGTFYVENVDISTDVNIYDSTTSLYSIALRKGIALSLLNTLSYYKGILAQNLSV